MEGSKSKRRRIETTDHVTDAEVEEFYAILRRIHLTRPVGLKVKSPPATWNPSFAPEDFQVSKPEPNNEQSGHRAPAVRRLLLDLNQDPEPEAVLGNTTTTG